MNHTPGPWITRYSDDAPSGKPLFSVDSQSAIVCAGAMESDARLIAAAPALLEALLDALPYVEDVLSDPAQLAAFKPGTVQRHAKAIRAAIAAATGEQ